MKNAIESKLKFSLLHSIRGIAALYVVVYHARFILWSGTSEYLLRFPRAGWHFVDYALCGIDLFFSAGSQMVIIFFVLSGFFITMTLQKNETSAANKFQQFYIIRCIRIYIPYVASIVFGTLVLFMTAKISPQLFDISSNREFNTRLLAARADTTWANFYKALAFTKNKE